MWRNRIPKLKTTVPSVVLVASDIRTYRKLTFDNVLAHRGSSFCYRVCLNFKAFSLRDLKWRQEKAVMKVKRWAIALVFVNSTVLALEEAFISMCQSSRVKIFIPIAKLSHRCFCCVTAAIFVPLRRAQTWRLHTKLYKFGWHTSANSARMKNSWDLILGGVVYIAIIYHILDSWIYLLNGFDF